MKTTSCLVNPTCLSRDHDQVGSGGRDQEYCGGGRRACRACLRHGGAERGHAVTLFDAANEIGGQFNLAKQVPGKEEFHETLRYYRAMPRSTR